MSSRQDLIDSCHFFFCHFHFINTGWNFFCKEFGSLTLTLTYSALVHFGLRELYYCWLSLKALPKHDDFRWKLSQNSPKAGSPKAPRKLFKKHVNCDNTISNTISFRFGSKIVYVGCTSFQRRPWPFGDHRSRSRFAYFLMIHYAQRVDYVRKKIFCENLSLHITYCAPTCPKAFVSTSGPQFTMEKEKVEGGWELRRRMIRAEEGGRLFMEGSYSWAG